MKKINYLFLLLLLVVFAPKVYAFTYDLDMVVDNTIVSEGTVKNIKVKLKNVQGVSDGFGACSLAIKFDDGIVLNGNVTSVKVGADTIVGNTMLRGISGGQRKRVTTGIC